MPKRIIALSRKQPARAILIVVCGLTLIAGMIMFTPLFGPVEAAPLFGGPVSIVGILVTGCLNILFSLPGLIGAVKNKRPWMIRGAFSMFLWYLFIALSRAILFPYPGRLLWFPSLIVSLVMGVVYLEQKNLLHVPLVVLEDERIGDGD